MTGRGPLAAPLEFVGGGDSEPFMGMRGTDSTEAYSQTMAAVIDAEVAELVGSIVPSADPLLVAQVQARSGGHPLSVEVLCLEARGGSAVGPELALEAAVDACSVEERQA